jgi:hypothetical protein
MPTSPLNTSSAAKNSLKVKALTREQIQQINEFLLAIGDYGEIHLIVQRGELRYINKLESHKVWGDDGFKGSASSL